MAGVLAGDVLKAADATGASADRARQGALPRCGWMDKDVPESPRWTERTPQREAELRKLEEKRRAVMERMGS